jgi:uncharacterized protein (TIGR01777 family)
MIAVTGATGFVGRAVCDALVTRGLKVVTIGRRADASIRWPAGGAGFDAKARDLLSRSRAVINLSGENIGRRWTASRRRAFRASRVDLTRLLSETLASLDTRPPALLSGSASGYYGDRGDDWMDESCAPSGDWLSQLVQDWEGATAPAERAGMRVVHMRLGVVFGRGGALSKMRLPFQLGLGGRLGSGQQWMSWVALDDVVDFVVRAIDDRAFSGPVNVVSPEPIRNADFTQLLARQLKRPAILPVPAIAMRAAFGEMAERLLLASQRLRPARLLANQFRFTHPDAESALRAAFNG